MSKAEAVKVLTAWFAVVHPTIAANNAGVDREVVHSVDENGYSREMLKPIVDSTSNTFLRSDGIRTTTQNTTYYHFETVKQDRVAFSRISRIEIWKFTNVYQNGILALGVHLYDDSGAPIETAQDVVTDPVPVADVASALLVLCTKIK